MDNSLARTPTATLTLDQSPGALIGGFVVQAQLDSFPTVVVWPHPNVPASKRVIQIAGSDVVKYLATQQRNKFALNPQLGLKLHATDGQGNTLDFNGIVTAPTLTSASNYYELRLFAQHDSAVLNTMRTNIYDAPIMSGAAEGSRKVNTVSLEEMNQVSLAERLRVLLEKMIQRRDIRLKAAVNPVPSEIVLEQAIDTANQPAIKLWGQILRDSNVTSMLDTLGILKDSEKGQRDNYLIHRSILNTLTACYMEGYDNFMDCIQRICGLFQLRYIPGLDATDPIGRYGLLVGYDRITAGTPIERITQIDAFSPALGVQELLPVRQILVRGQTSLSRKLSANVAAREGQLPILSAWPYAPVGAGGRVRSVSPPSWLPPAPVPIADAFLAKLIAAKGTKSIEEIQTWSQVRSEQAVTENELISKLLQKWAQNYYRESAIGNDQVNISVPLDFSWKIGRRYRIISEGSADGSVPETPLFTGFLNGLSHTLRIESDQRGAQSTALNFSHVTMNGFTLAGL